MNDLSIMEKFSDPELIQTLTFGEKSIGALITTLMGMGITFIILTMLWGIIALMAKLTAEKPKPPKGSSEGAPAKTATATNPAASTITNASTTPGISPELIAVITAAIESFEGKTVSAGNLIIRKISRAAGQATAWGSAGNSEAIASRKF